VYYFGIITIPRFVADLAVVHSL